MDYPRVSQVFSRIHLIGEEVKTDIMSTLTFLKKWRGQEMTFTKKGRGSGC